MRLKYGGGCERQEQSRGHTAVKSHKEPFQAFSGTRNVHIKIRRAEFRDLVIMVLIDGKLKILNSKP